MQLLLFFPPKEETKVEEGKAVAQEFLEVQWQCQMTVLMSKLRIIVV